LIDNNVTGEVMVQLNHEYLKEMDIKSVGDRMKILIAVKDLKTKGPVNMELTPRRKSSGIQRVCD
jgi:hypothetical protein